jgi:type IV secretory pathway component VirB8
MSVTSSAQQRNEYENNGDKLGVYPREVNVAALSHRQYLWTSRAFAIGFFLSIMLNIALAFALSSLVPLQKVQPMLVTFSDNDEQIVHIQTFRKGSSGINLFAEKMAAQYVKLREEILLDSDEMVRRWNQKLKYFMNKNDYLAFMNRMQEIYEEIRKRGYSRTITINDIKRTSANHVIIQYTSNDFDRNGQKIQELYWTARMKIGFISRDLRAGEQYNNPLGFTVFDYSLVKNNG